MSLKELAGELNAVIDDVDAQVQTFVVAVALAQTRGEYHTSVSTEELLDTLGCHRTGECECFAGMVNTLLDEVSSDDSMDHQIHMGTNFGMDLGAAPQGFTGTMRLDHGVMTQPIEHKTTYAPVINDLRGFKLSSKG